MNPRPLLEDDVSMPILGPQYVRLSRRAIDLIYSVQLRGLMQEDLDFVMLENVFSC